MALLAMAAWPSPAAADAAQPTDFRSEITSIEPSLPDGVDVRVVGNDAFLEVRARDVEVVVPDYEADAAPYLRFRTDGVVERNRRAAATAANETRYGTAEGDPYDADAQPDWEVVATNGTYAWHDHRIHWMSPNPPRAVADDGVVDLGGPDGSWRVPLVVDGTPTAVTGQLRLSPSPSPLPWLAGGAALATALVLLVRARSIPGSRWVTAGVALASSIGALGASFATWTAAPAGSDPSPVPLGLSVAACLAAGTLVVAVARRRPSLALPASAAVAALLLTWGWARWPVLTRAHLPSELPAALDRGATAVALGVAAALVIGLLSTQRDEVPPKASPSVT